ncbi:GNAT family N-acetyltransferase [Cellulosimicrobium protaetiae]|uniref:GNAT family N-acetyltransferase n=1 Tax=Cellulosimicrobium protaetiae TaxID=2587808 RepID=A0A6M5UBY8_9MICO|nr:GNAT family N-acetyltransferase [Cellulosimicrobium protaetiae]QJW35770.1 GNAT family N-acetyltransferase [Cellulosimicrobium protaetiae]
MPTTTVARVRPDDWRDLRDVRLRALADAPSAFGSTLAREVAFPDDVWRERAAQGRTLLARQVPDGGAAAGRDRSPGAVVGIATVVPSPDDPTAADLVSVWVDPAARGGGVAAALLRSADALAAELGARTLALWVTATNTPARTLYERAGFAATGETKPLPSDPRLVEVRMTRPVRG